MFVSCVGGYAVIFRYDASRVKADCKVLSNVQCSLAIVAKLTIESETVVDVLTIKCVF